MQPQLERTASLKINYKKITAFHSFKRRENFTRSPPQHIIKNFLKQRQSGKNLRPIVAFYDEKKSKPFLTIVEPEVACKPNKLDRLRQQLFLDHLPKLYL